VQRIALIEAARWSRVRESCHMARSSRARESWRMVRGGWGRRLSIALIDRWSRMTHGLGRFMHSIAHRPAR